MAGLRLKTGSALSNLAFIFLGRAETLSGSRDMSLFPDVGRQRVFPFSKDLTGAHLVHGSA